MKVSIPVEVSTNAFAPIVGCLKNLSLSGALVQADVDLGLHSLVQVHITRPSPSQPAATVTAYVSRRAKDGIGVEWCEFGPTVVKDLLRSPPGAVPPA